MRDRRREEGLILILVLLFALLLASTVTTLLRRASVDVMVVENRDASREAEALARGGLALARALLIEDLIQQSQDGELAVEASDDLWARMRDFEVPGPAGGTLRLEIEDAGSRLNLNALFDGGEVLDAKTEVFLEEILAKVILEMPGRPEDKLYDPRDLARNLIDFIDEDEERRDTGTGEDDFYQSQDPPYRALNRPLVSLDELRLVEGFDGRLVEALAPYLTVYPLAGGDGINLNTAPSWVLSLIYHGVSDEYRLADQELVEDVLEVRESGNVICDGETSHERCIPLREIVADEIFPPPSFTTEVFTVVAQAEVGEVVRRVEAVLDRSQEGFPALLSWRIR